MSKTIKIWIGVVVLALIFLVTGSKMGWFGKKGNFKEVTVKEVFLKDIVETVSATGKIQPEVEVQILSEISGEIMKLPHKEGAQVKKGDLLAVINPDLIEASINRSKASYQSAKANLELAEATLKQAKADYDRSESLFKKGVISKADWDAALANYETAIASRNSASFVVQSAGATVKEANNNLERSTLYSPINGTISSLNFEVGELVAGIQQMSITEVMRVADLSRMEVEIDVNENDIVKVNIGDSTIVEVDAYLKKEFKGVVTEIANSADGGLSADQVTNYKVKVRILEDSYKDLREGKPAYYSPFRPGMTATVDIITKTRKNAIAVPISAIVVKADTSATKKTNEKSANTDDTTKDEQKFECVFVNDNGKAKLRIVKTGIQDDTNIEIIEGLNKGDKIITGPYNMVSKILEAGDLIEDTNEGSKVSDSFR